MSKYLYPIYKTKLKPWIKYWLIKKTSVKPVSGTYTLAQGGSPLTITKALKAPIRSLSLYGDCNQVQRAGTNLAELNSTQDTSKYTYSSFTASNIIVEKTATGGSFYAAFTLHIPAAGTYYIKGNAISLQQMYIYTDSLWGTLKEQFAVSAGDFSRGTNFSTAGTYILGLYGSATGNYGVKDFMLCNTEALPYEPYGYKPSPTNPSEVQTITGQTSFTISDGTSSTFSIIPLGSIELCKIGDYSDRIYKENDKWYLEKKIGKVVLNGSGSENWSLNTAAPSETTKYFQSNVIDGTKMASTTGLCNRFLVTAEGIWSDNGEKMQLHNSTDNIRMRINTSLASTVSELQTWLASNNVTLYYVLAEATTTEITDDLLLTILNGLENLETFKGTNVVSFSDLNPNISFEYLKED